MKFYNPSIDKSQYLIAKYFIKSKNVDLKKAAWDLAIGQSVGNPNVRNQWETEELFEQSSCVIVHDKDELKDVYQGVVKIGFPIINSNWEEDGISHLLCIINYGCGLGARAGPGSVLRLSPKKTNVSELLFL